MNYDGHDRRQGGGAGELVWKLAIILIWLALPLTAWNMLRQDHERYLQDSALQEQNFEEHRRHIQNFSELFMIQATAVYTIDSSAEKREWEREWRSVQKLQKAEQEQLEGLRIDYFPASRRELDELRGLLERQQQAVEEAARLREAYIKSSDGLTSIAERIDRARMTAEYYRRLGAQGIYLLVMEDLDILEARYRDYRHDRQRLLSDATQELSDAEHYGREIQQGMRRLDQAIAIDADKSYEQKLRERFADFNLRSELDRLISGEAQASQAPQQSPGGTA